VDDSATTVADIQFMPIFVRLDFLAQIVTWIESVIRGRIATKANPGFIVIWFVVDPFLGHVADNTLNSLVCGLALHAI